MAPQDNRHQNWVMVHITMLNCEILSHKLANIIEKKYHSQVSTYEKEIENKVHDFLSSPRKREMVKTIIAFLFQKRDHFC